MNETSGVEGSPNLEEESSGIPDGSRPVQISREEILQRGKDAFRAKIQQEKRRLFDPLLGEFWVFPMTIREKQSIYSVYEDQGKQLLALARVIVVRAKREDGRRIFKDSDFVDVISAWDSDDIERIARNIQEDLTDGESDAVGELADSGN